MPIVRIEILEGRPPEVKTALIQGVTDAVVAALSVRREQVRVLLYELPPEHWAVGGSTMAGPLRAPEATGGDSE